MIASERKSFNPAEYSYTHSISIDSTGLPHIECAFHFQLFIRLECISMKNIHFYYLLKIVKRWFSRLP